MHLQIRWLIRRDMPQVLAIETASFDSPWTEDEFLDALQQRSMVGMVADDGGQARISIRGFMFYELHKTRLQIVNFAVHPDSRRQGIGRALVERLKAKLSADRRQHLIVCVGEANLSAQLFWQAMGFQCVRVERGRYENGDDGYWFRYTLRQPRLFTNRITDYLEADA